MDAPPQTFCQRSASLTITENISLYCILIWRQTKTVPYNSCPSEVVIKPSSWQPSPERGDWKLAYNSPSGRGPKMTSRGGDIFSVGIFFERRQKFLFWHTFSHLDPSMHSSKLLSSSPSLVLAVATTLIIRENDNHHLQSCSFLDYCCLKFLRCLFCWIVDCSFSVSITSLNLSHQLTLPSSANSFILLFIEMSSWNTYFPLLLIFFSLFLIIFSLFFFFILSTPPAQDFIILISISHSLAKSSHPLLVPKNSYLIFFTSPFHKDASLHAVKHALLWDTNDFDENLTMSQ